MFYLMDMNFQVTPSYFLAFCAIFMAGCEPRLLNMASSWESLSCCGLIVLILDVIAIIEVAGSSRTTAGKVIWIFLILCTPVLGLIFYYTFANRS